ncbi:MAG: nucleoside deaminase [Bacteroidota bacterium]|nr:nucleoside deaminase [Bacteroidota bacterium]
MNHSEEHIHEKMMNLALKQAALAGSDNEVPIGAIITDEFGKVIAKGYNQCERLNDPTAHAEMLAITAACTHFGSKYLQKCTIYVTVEPCPMCAGAIKWAQIATIVYGTDDPKAGYTAIDNGKLFPSKIKIVKGILQEKCSELMLDFFRGLR